MWNFQNSQISIITVKKTPYVLRDGTDLQDTRTTIQYSCTDKSTIYENIKTSKVNIKMWRLPLACFYPLILRTCHSCHSRRAFLRIVSDKRVTSHESHHFYSYLSAIQSLCPRLSFGFVCSRSVWLQACVLRQRDSYWHRLAYTSRLRSRHKFKL